MEAPDLMFTCTYGAEEPERATVPFIAATVAAASGQRAVVVCTAEAVRLGTSGGTEGVAAPGMVLFADQYEAFVAAGGEVWLCSACVNARGITESDLGPGAIIVGAAVIVEAAVSGAKSISLT